jgi:predicted membrane protein
MQIKPSSLSRMLAVAAILSGIMVPANAQTYTSFDALPNGTFPTEMDSSGRIVGTAIETGNQVASAVFIRNTDGTITLTSAPASDWAGFSGASNIVGRYQDSAAVEHGYVGPIAGPFTTFDVSGAAGTYPWKSNSAGVIVGLWTNSANQVHGFMRSAAGTITKFDVPGSATTQPETINTSGQIAGLYTDSSGVLHGFIRSSSGTYTTYNFPAGSVYGSAHLNDAGQVAGYYADRNFTSKGYLRDTNGTLTTLSLAGQVSVGDINQGGSIVGVFGGKYHGRKDGYLRRPDGTSATIEFPGANTINSSTKALDINQVGVIMGQYQLTTLSNGDTTWHGFVVTGVH